MHVPMDVEERKELSVMFHAIDALLRFAAMMLFFLFSLTLETMIH